MYIFFEIILIMVLLNSFVTRDKQILLTDIELFVRTDNEKKPLFSEWLLHF